MNLYGFGDNRFRVKGQRSINVQNPVKMMRNYFCYSDNLRTTKGITTKLGSIMYIDREMNLCFCDNHLKVKGQRSLNV